MITVNAQVFILYYVLLILGKGNRSVTQIKFELTMQWNLANALM